MSGNYCAESKNVKVLEDQIDWLRDYARSITRKPRKSRSLRKFGFPSQTEHSPPITIFVHGINP